MGYLHFKTTKRGFMRLFYYIDLHFTSFHIGLLIFRLYAYIIVHIEM